MFEGAPSTVQYGGLCLPGLEMQRRALNPDV